MNKEIKWVKYVTRSLSPYKLDLYFRGLISALKRNFAFNYDNLMIIAKGIECEIYIGEDDLKQFGELIKNHFLGSIDADKDPFGMLNKITEDLLKTTEEIGKRKHVSKDDLLNSFKELIKKTEDYQVIIWFPVICEDVFFPYARNRFFPTDQKSWDIICEPFEPSVIQKEMIDLLEIAIDYSEEKLTKHKEKYSWMSMRFVDNEPYDIDHFKKRIEEIKEPKLELARIKKELHEKKERFYNLINSLRISEKEKKLLIAINKLNLLRQTRDGGRRKAWFYAKKFYNQLLERLECDYKTFLSYLPDEIIKNLENDKKIDSARNLNNFIHVTKNGNFELITEDIEKRLENEGIKKLDIEQVNEFQGTVASQGKVKGKVKIITLNNWAKDCADLRKGDILVAISTKPDYIVAMERAAAFVTDEGGITCHAAIVSREMGKPCIVGTNVATKILKDGDLVEVDAEKGIIKKIN